MRNVFREFYYKETLDFKKLENEVLVVFDTNVLLNIYRYSNTTRKKLINAIKSIEENIWMPYQIGLEFNLDRQAVRSSISGQKDKICKKIDNDLSSMIASLSSCLDNFEIKSIDGIEKRKEIKENFEKKFKLEINTFLKQELEVLDKMIDKESDKHDEIVDLFSGKTGQCYTQEEINEILIDAEERFINEIPPGYKDNSKKDKTIYNNIMFEKKFGDLIIWNQIMDKAKDEKIKKVVFITDDSKEDWWYIDKGKKIGARAELKKEILNTSQADLFMIDTNSFLSQINEEDKNLVDTSNDVLLKSELLDKTLNDYYIRNISEKYKSKNNENYFFIDEVPKIEFLKKKLNLEKKHKNLCRLSKDLFNKALLNINNLGIVKEYSNSKDNIIKNSLEEVLEELLEISAELHLDFDFNTNLKDLANLKSRKVFKQLSNSLSSIEERLYEIQNKIRLISFDQDCGEIKSIIKSIEIE